MINKHQKQSRPNTCERRQTNQERKRKREEGNNCPATATQTTYGHQTIRKNMVTHRTHG
jgi:hypothetical protein